MKIISASPVFGMIGTHNSGELNFATIHDDDLFARYRNSRTTGQHRIRNFMSATSKNSHLLTNAKRNAWQAYAAT